MFALEYGASQMCYLADMYKHLSAKPVRLTLMRDSQTTIDSLRSVRPIIYRMHQHLLDNVKKSVDQEGIRVKFVGTEDNLADPLAKRISVGYIG